MREGEPRIEDSESEDLKANVAEMAERLGVPIFTEEDMDEKLGDKPYATHTFVGNQENILKVLESGELQSSKELGKGTMTWEGDKLMGMDENVFFALGKGYIRPGETYSLVFDPEILAKSPDASFVKDDLAKFEGQVVSDFLEENSGAVVKSIEDNRVALKEYFEKMVLHGFEGGHGIYEDYFGDNARDRVQDFLDAIKAKGFKGIAQEKAVIDQFTILSNAILSEGIMPDKLRNKLKKDLQEKVIKPHTVIGAKNINAATSESWQANGDSYKHFLQPDQVVPEKVTEIRIPGKMKIGDVIIGIYIPNK